MNSLEKLLYLTGISAEYLDYSGHRQIIPHEMRIETLRHMGFAVDSIEDVEKAVFEIDSQPWSQLCRAFNILDQASSELTVFCAQEDLQEPVHWSIELDGKPAKASALSGKVAPQSLSETGEYYLDERRYSSRLLPLGNLPLGYHSVQLNQGKRKMHATVAVCPQRSYRLPTEKKLWGFCCQLYTLRSERNCGYGDFLDLRELIQLAHVKGADFVGINPCHAPLSSNADTPSPYSPSDRRRINPLYIAIEDIPEVRESSQLQKAIQARFAVLFTSLRRSADIDYEGVTRAKYAVFELAYDSFQNESTDPDYRPARELDQYVQRSGTPMADFAEYEVQHNQYAERHRADVRFYQYLQWIAEQQLAACDRFAHEIGMQIGVLGDLAVGAVAEGCEVQMNADLYLPDVKIGAPPDPFSETGQNWGLPVPVPSVLRQQGFAHFIHLLQANMQHVSALRIDHAMALMRLWWCLPGESRDARDGVYVYYPFAELMSLLRLESQLNECLIVAEDLGVVPDEFRQEMSASGLFSNKIFYFEQGYDGRFFHADQQPADALLMITNHDVSTLSEWWSGRDLQRRNDLGLFSAELFASELTKRDQDKEALLEWLAENKTLPTNWTLRDCERDFDFDLCKAIHRSCAKSNAKLLSLQLEDFQMDIPPINIPGTCKEYANWKRKQLVSTADLLNSSVASGIANAINEERK